MSAPPKKLPNKERRSREYLAPHEVDTLISTAKLMGRHGYRNSIMLLLEYRHGLRVSEVIALKWQQVDLKAGLLHVQRRKNGVDATHPLFGPEIRGLRKLLRDYPETPYVFVSERKSPFTTSNVRKIIANAGKLAGFDLPIHPHMLRHSVGFKLANEGHDTRSIQHYLGHKNIAHTSRYTEIVPEKFNKFWKD